MISKRLYGLARAILEAGEKNPAVSIELPLATGNLTNERGHWDPRRLGPRRTGARLSLP